jgi:hypothetical protein
MANTPSLVETMWLAFNRQDNFDYLLSLMKMGFTAKETVQLLPVREGNGEEETSFWELPVNVDGQHRNLLCVCFNADPKISGAFQKAAYPSLWFLQVSSFLPDAPSTFIASEIQGGSWEIQGKDMCGFVGLCAAITEATEKLDLKAPVEKLVDIVSADGSILIKHHLIQPEVQATPGESMAANKEFDPLAAEKTWTFSWRQWMGNFWAEKYKVTIDTETDGNITNVHVIPFNPSEKTFAQDSNVGEIVQLFRKAHFPVKKGVGKGIVMNSDSSENHCRQCGKGFIIVDEGVDAEKRRKTQ